MSHTPHELAEEFPDLKDRIHELKVGDAHFRRLFDEYHALNREVHRHEAAGGDIDDAHMDELKRQRLDLKDQLYAMLTR